MREVAPGRYETTFPLDRYGAFALHAVHRREGHTVAESYGQVNNPYPREYAALEPDAALLSQIASATGGRVDPTVPQMFDAAGETIRETQPLWRYPIFAAIAVLLIDIALRRVRFFDRSFKSGRKRRVVVARAAARGA
jgi:hypothetical protein